MKKLRALFAVLLRGIADALAPEARKLVASTRPVFIEMAPAEPAKPADKLEALVQLHGPLTQRAQQIAAVVYLEDALQRYQPKRVPGLA